ncbi:MAG: hypothetical protein KJ741_03480 [Proteobacteria bacterium]|nr:hypothetical protein [Pseudomonadota bacterium]
METDPNKTEYLCQVSDTISCGNCCGLYNVQDSSLESLQDMLAYRSKVFMETPRNMDSILAFKDHIREKEPDQRPIRDFYHCPYIGLTGKDHNRVGCLLHPAGEGNKGVDLRGLSFYGSMTCNMYFCPSARNLPARFAAIVKTFSESWHQYGLIITETTLLTEFFGELERRINRPISMDMFSGHPGMIVPVIDFFRLKIRWPFRPKSHAYGTNYFFNDGIYPKPKVKYPPDWDSKSRHDIFFREMVSVFFSKAELLRGEDLLEGVFSRFHAAFQVIHEE